MGDIAHERLESYSIFLRLHDAFDLLSRLSLQGIEPAIGDSPKHDSTTVTLYCETDELTKIFCANIVKRLQTHYKTDNKEL